MIDPEVQEALAGYVDRLEEIAAALRDPGATPDDLRRLSDEALELSTRINELLPRVAGDAG